MDNGTILLLLIGELFLGVSLVYCCVKLDHILYRLEDIERRQNGDI